MTALEIVDAKTINTEITLVEKEIAVEEVAQRIKNYCNIDSIPRELNFTWANMACDLIRYQNEVNKRDSRDGDDVVIHSGDISSLNIGDTSVSLGSGSETDAGNRAIKSHRPNLDDLLMNYRDELKRFRRMVW